MILKHNVLELLEAANFSKVMEAFPSGVIICNSSGKIIYCNNELLDMFGYSREELIDQAVEILIPSQFHEHHPSYLKGFMAKPAKRSMGIGKEVSGQRKDGQTFPVEIGLSPLRNAEEDIVIASVVDVTQRKQMEGTFQSIIEGAPVGILITNQSGVITHVNSQLLNIFGYSEQELLGQAVESLLPMRHRKQHVHNRDGFFSDPSARTMGFGRDLTGMHQSGVEIPIEIGLNPVVIDNQKAVIATVIDITKRKKSEARLYQLNADLDEFTYVASHDLKSPIRGIGDLLEWIEEDLGEDILPEVKKNLDRAQLRIARVQKLMDDLLSFAKSGHLDAELREINVSKLLHDVVSDMTTPPGFSFRINTDIETLTVASVPLETVLRNLVSNAIKHHDNDEGHIELNVYDDGDYCIFSVKDDGASIPEKAQARIFKLFQTLSSNKNSEHSGVGLAVVKRLVESQGGKIEIHSIDNERGNEFNFWWPRYPRIDISE